MRLSVCYVLLVVWTANVTGQSLPVALPVQAPDREERVQAATSDAINRLMKDIGDEALTDRLTIDAALTQTEARDALRAVVRQANQIGGVRWLGDDTAQVQLEIGGEAVAAEVRRLLRKDVVPANLPAADLEPGLAALAKKKFTATGSSTTAAVIETVKPAGRDVWAGIDEQARRAAIADAKAHAVDSVLASIRGVRLSDGRSLDKLLDESDSMVRTRLREHLFSRPVTSVQFHESREVEVTLSAPPVETFAVIRSALVDSGAGEISDEEWARIQVEFLDQIGAATGRGAIPQPNLILPVQPQVRLPEQAPLWVSDMLDVQGTAQATESRLKTMRAAERQALTDLRAQVLDLPLTPDLNIGDAASSDPEIAAAVDRAISRARTYKSDYYADGRVVVRTSLDLRDVWEQLHRYQP